MSQEQSHRELIVRTLVSNTCREHLEQARRSGELEELLRRLDEIAPSLEGCDGKDGPLSSLRCVLHLGLEAAGELDALATHEQIGPVAACQGTDLSVTV